MRVAIVANSVRVRCHAAAPGSANPTDPRGQRCNTVLGDLPRSVKFVGTSPRAPAVPEDNGHYVLRCSRRDCKMWNVFEESDG